MIQHKKLSLALMVLLTVSLLLNGCFRPPSDGPTAPQRGITGTITTGKPVFVSAAPISPAGGTVAVIDSASPLTGLEIDVPPNSYSSATQFEVSYSPIEKHTFSEAFNPVTPMITIDNGGSYSEELIEVKVPVSIPEGHFAMGFLYDDETKQLEGLPLLAQDADSITIGTRHFSNLVISIIDVALLYKDIDSGFRVGVDDWQFTNYGSSIAPEGHCSGQSMTAMWYYITRPDGKDVSLFGRYDNNGNQPATPKFWLDDSLAYRFSSVVQNDADWNSLLRKITRGILSKDPEITFRLFAYSMLLTGEPQYVAVANTKEGGGHALVLYRISGGKLYVSDPNYPGMALRYIEYTDGVFKPYSSGASAAEIEKGNGKEYDLIAYTAKTSLVDWGKISSRWEEVKNGTIGNDSFLSYKTVWLDDQGKAHELTDGTVSPDKILNIGFQYQGGMPTRWSVYRDGVRLSAGQKIFPGTSSYELEPGNNKLGILLNAVINGQEQYINFKYVNVVYTEPTTPAPTETVTTPTTAEKQWKLVETVLPKLPEMPVKFSDQFGSHSMTLTVTENKIISDVRTLGGPGGSETGASIMTLTISGMPDVVTLGKKVEMTGTWDITVSGKPRYASSAVELRRGEFQGTSKPISLEQNPTGSLTFTWSPGGDEFEVTARLTVRGNTGLIRWVYRTE